MEAADVLNYSMDTRCVTDLIGQNNTSIMLTIQALWDKRKSPMSRHIASRSIDKGTTSSKPENLPISIVLVPGSKTNPVMRIQPSAHFSRWPQLLTLLQPRSCRTRKKDPRPSVTNLVCCPLGLRRCGRDAEQTRWATHHGSYSQAMLADQL